MKVINIKPDIDCIFTDEQGISYYFDENDFIEGVYDHARAPIHITGLKEWCEELYPIIIASETCQPYDKGWNDYHKRGLEYAHQLREVLSNDFELWYEAPFEDKSREIPIKKLIVKNSPVDGSTTISPNVLHQPADTEYFCS